MLPKLAFTGFISRYREPEVSEGFQDVVKVDFEVHRYSLHTVLLANAYQ
jgi:hypothetical protein